MAGNAKKTPAKQPVEKKEKAADLAQTNLFKRIPLECLVIETYATPVGDQFGKYTSPRL